MKSRYKILLACVGVVAVFLSGMLAGISGCAEKASEGAEVTETVETRMDTIPYYAPVAAEEVVVGREVRRFARVRTGEGERGTVFWGQENRRMGFSGQENRGTEEPEDSVAVEIPIVQRHYRDSTYEAWVSGYEARLDSVRVFAPTTVITRREWKPPKRWHVGVTAGYGYGPKGLQPYVGIGITYSIISF